MIPLRDENPSRTFPIVNYALIAANIVVFLWEVTNPPQAVNRYLMIPAAVTGSATAPPGVLVQPAFVSIFSAMFMHAGFLHIAGNLLYLWIFGDNVEDMLGHGRYLLFYLCCGVAAAGAQIASDPTSTVPTLGASGAIAGVLGAYLVTHPGAYVFCIVTLIFFWQTMWVPAWLVLGGWIALQFVSESQVVHRHQQGGVAYLAHIGGFMAGIVLFYLLGGRGAQRPPARRSGWGYPD